MDGYILLRTFSNKSEIQDFIDFLKAESFHYKIERLNFDLMPFMQLSSSETYGLFIRHQDSAQLDKIIEDQFSDLSMDDHPLNQLDIDELIDVLKKPDEWSFEDVVMTRRILSKRGRTITDSEIEEFKKQRLSELKKQKKGEGIYVILGFIIPLFGVYVAGRMGLPGFIIYSFGFGISLNYLLDYKKLPNGERIKAYDSKTRKTGLIMLLWSLAITILSVLYLVLYL